MRGGLGVWRWLGAVVFAAAAVLLPAVAAADELRVGVVEGEASAFEAELIGGLCAAMQQACTVTVLVPEALREQFFAGELDVVRTHKTGKKLKKATLSTKALFVNGGKFMVRKKSDIKISYKTLGGKTIGVESGTVFARFAAASFKGATIKQYNDIADAAADLTAGGIDAVLAGNIAQRRLVREYPKLHLKGPTYRKAKYFLPLRLHFARNQTSEGDIARWDDGIAAYKKSPVYRSIVTRHF